MALISVAADFQKLFANLCGTFTAYCFFTIKAQLKCFFCFKLISLYKGWAEEFFLCHLIFENIKSVK